MGVVLNVAQSGGDGATLILLGLGLLEEGVENGAQVFQGSNQAIRAAAIRNNIPTAAIDDIIKNTKNFTVGAKWVGRGFVAAGVVVSVIDINNALKEGDTGAATLGLVDIGVGLGTAAVGGPLGVVLYGSYMLIMHHPIMPSGPDPLPAYPADNTYVAPRY